MYCSKCGSQINEATKKCEKCGLSVENNISGKELLLYDYITLEAKQKLSTEVSDWYEMLGFEVVACKDNSYVSREMTFKRDRKIKNKEQLLKIQTRLDDSIKGLQKLESQKTTAALSTSIVLGVAGTLTFGGGMCLCLLKSSILGAMIGGIALGVVGLGICGLAYFAYKKICAKKSMKLNPIIAKKRDDICAICEEAKKLI